jgi:hypothetical protein
MPTYQEDRENIVSRFGGMRDRFDLNMPHRLL